MDTKDTPWWCKTIACIDRYEYRTDTGSTVTGTVLYTVQLRLSTVRYKPGAYSERTVVFLQYRYD